MSRAMKDSKIPFAPQIPETWKEIPNRFLFIEHSSKVGERWKEYQLLSLTTSGVKEKNINDTGGKVPDSYDNYQTVEKGDMVFCLFDLDCSAVFSGLSPYDGMITSAYDVFRTNEKYLDNTYARFWFDYVFSRRYYKMFSKNIRYTITTDVFKGIYTPCPPIAEQKKIGAFLDKKCGEIDEMVSLQEKIVEELKAYKQSVITEVVCKGLNPNVPMKDSGIEWIGRIPEGWEATRVKWLLVERKERSQKGEEEPLSMSQKLGLVPTREMDIVPNMASTFEGAKLVYVGDLVFNKLKAHLGVFSTSRYNGLVSPDYAVYYGTGRANVEYLEFLFKTPQCIGEFKKRITGVASGLSRLYTSDLFSLYCPLPPIEEQEEIVSFLLRKRAEIDSLISVRQAKIEALKEYKKSIIYEYITGKKEING